MMAHKENAAERRLPGYQVRRIAVAADVHPRTVSRVLAGLPTRGAPRERIERALAEAGLSRLIPQAARDV
jgi:hypothetical protein